MRALPRFGALLAAALAVAGLVALLAPSPLPARAAEGPLAGGPAPTPREVVGKLVEILARPEFEGSDEEEEGLLLVLANLLSDLVDRVKEMRRSDPVIYGTLVAWLALSLLAILGHVAWTVWRGGVAGRAGGRRGDGALDPALATRAGRDPDRMLARADAEAAAGRIAEAIPWLYLALLFRLERAGRLAFDPARTGLEYADALAPRPGDRRLWLRFLRLHDPVVFGARPCAAGTLEEMRGMATAPLPAGDAAEGEATRGAA